jgi:hypothetical protein
MGQLPITNVVNISVSQAQVALGEYNVNNLALFTKDAPAASFGEAGYGLYLDPTQVGVDFGTQSETYLMANQVFSQQPNILAGGGYLAVIPLYTLTQTLTPSGSPVSGSFALSYGAGSISVAAAETAGSIQAALQTVVTAQTPGVTVAVSGSFSAGNPLVFTFSGGTVTLPLVIGTNTTSATFTQASTYETLGAAITRTQGLVNYFGILPTYIAGSSEAQAAAAIAQALNVLLGIVSNVEADIEPSGFLYTMTQAQLTHTRGLYYGGTDAEALLFSAGYFGRGLSTNFTGSNTTETLHLKQIIGTTADLSLTQTYLNKAIAAGADTYPSLQGVPGIYCSGANDYFDNQYNLLWLVGALQVAGFNYLASAATKIPQTEQGMNGLKGAYRAVCQQAVANQFVAPGSWTSPSTFGNQLDFFNNISSFGYYIYSSPVSQQSAANRASRIAPLVQIAIKYAGAIQSSNVVVFVNP